MKSRYTRFHRIQELKLEQVQLQLGALKQKLEKVLQKLEQEKEAYLNDRDALNQDLSKGDFSGLKQSEISLDLHKKNMMNLLAKRKELQDEIGFVYNILQQNSKKVKQFEKLMEKEEKSLREEIKQQDFKQIDMFSNRRKV